MKKILGAKAIFSNIKKLKGLTAKKQVAEFFGVGPSAVTDWTNRKGDSIPARRLAYASTRHGIRWQWLAYGEGDPYEEPAPEAKHPLPLAPSEVELLEKIKTSPQFRRAVERLLCLDDEKIKLIAKVAESMNDPAAAKTSKTPKKVASVAPFHTSKVSRPLTTLK